MVYRTDEGKFPGVVPHPVRGPTRRGHFTRRLSLRVLAPLLLVGIGVFAALAAEGAHGFPGTTVILLNHTGDPIVRNLDIGQYSRLGTLPATRFVWKNVFNPASSRYSVSQLPQLQQRELGLLRSTLGQLIDVNPSARYFVVFGGHGQTTGPGIDGLYSTRFQISQMTSDLFQDRGAKGALVFDDCGSGNVCVNYGQAVSYTHLTLPTTPYV